MSDYSYSVVEFTDGIHVIPNNWITKENGNTFSYWPPSKTDKFRINKYIHSKESPKNDWERYEIVRIFCETATYERATEKLNLAVSISDIDTADELNVKKTRHDRHSRRSFDSTESDCDENRAKYKRMQRTRIDSSEDDLIAPFTSSCSTVSLPSVPRKMMSNTYKQFLPSCETPNTSVHSSQCNTATLRHERDFNEKCLGKLNVIISKLNNIESRLVEIEKYKGVIEAANNKTHISLEYMDTFPIKDLTKFQEFEEKLKKKSYFDKMINILSCIGGHDIQSITVNILRKLLSNEVATKFSLQGKKKSKLCFKEQLSYQLVLQIVRQHKPTATEIEIADVLAPWLVQAKLRYDRELEKAKKNQALQE